MTFEFMPSARECNPIEGAESSDNCQNGKSASFAAKRRGEYNYSMRLFLALIVAMLPCFNAQGQSTTLPDAYLAVSAPELHQLFTSSLGRSLRTKLADYAIAQNYTTPDETIMIVTHELIHIQSAASRAFWVQGQLFEPYLPGAWPSLTLEQYTARISQANPLTRTTVYQQYAAAPQTRTNTLRGLADELNAWGQTMPWHCRYRRLVNRPANPQALEHYRDTIRLTADYLAVLRTHYPSQYADLHGSQRPARNFLALVLKQALAGLATCEAPPLSSSDQLEVSQLIQRAESESGRR